MKNTIKAGIVGLGITAAMATGVGVASADPGTVSTGAAATAAVMASQFTADLTNAGFYNANGAGAQLALGASVCNAIDAGNSPLMAAMALYRSSDLTAYQSGQFLPIAVKDLCPWNIPAVVAATRGGSGNGSNV